MQKVATPLKLLSMEVFESTQQVANIVDKSAPKYTTAHVVPGALIVHRIVTHNDLLLLC